MVAGAGRWEQVCGRSVDVALRCRATFRNLRRQPKQARAVSGGEARVLGTCRSAAGQAGEQVPCTSLPICGGRVAATDAISREYVPGYLSTIVPVSTIHNSTTAVAFLARQ